MRTYVRWTLAGLFLLSVGWRGAAAADGCVVDDALVEVVWDRSEGAVDFRIDPLLVEREALREDYEDRLRRFFGGADVADAVAFFRERPRTSLRVFDRVRRADGGALPTVLLYRSLEPERIPLLDAMWDLVLENRYFELRILYLWFVERSHSGIVPLLHFIMSSPGMELEDRLLAAAFLHKLGDASGREFVQAVHASAGCAEHHPLIEDELWFVLAGGHAEVRAEEW